MEEYEKYERYDEILIGHKPVPMNIANKAMKSICKIFIKGINENNIYGTGFFMKISNSLKCLITNYHVISPQVINQNIELEIWNNKKMKLNISNRYIAYFEKPNDITVIQIKDTDSIYNDILLLGYDSNYIDNGYDIYKNNDIFTVQHPKGKDAACASGIIVHVNGSEFDHNIPTEEGSSGCPIILLNNNINLIQVIGIHKNGDNYENVNGGTFIGEIINNINNNYININDDININNKDKGNIKKSEEKKNNNDEVNSSSNNNNRDNNNLNLKNNKKILENEVYYNDEQIAEIIQKLNMEYNSKKGEENYIISEIDINEKNVNKEIRIINSFEEWAKPKNFLSKYFNKIDETGRKNENEIKKCEIKINDKSILFTYKYKFTKLGKNIIKYQFKNLLTKADFLFADCNCLSKIDLSHFNSQNVDNMRGMFTGCTSLTNINLTNFNTKNVTDMSCIFSCCKSLYEIDLSSFDTKKVINMEGMFSECTNLLCIDLSNFNIENVKTMACLFYGCKNIVSINLSSFNTINVTKMNFMFYDCESLSYIDLSSFNTQNVTDMANMFYGCNSITDLNLSSFTTKSSTKLDDMFTNCKFINGGKIIANDERIKQKFNEVYNSENTNPLRYYIEKYFI